MERSTKRRIRDFPVVGRGPLGIGLWVVLASASCGGGQLERPDGAPSLDAGRDGAFDASEPNPADATPDGPAPITEDGWRLVWSDEFDGSEVDLSRWQHEVNCWGGGNGEDQCYVADAKNSFVRDGELHIVALADRPSGAVGGPGDDPAVVTKGHSSARLRTLGQGDWRYGRVEVRARLPFGQGIWPAIWMLPTDGIYGGWAQSGEIDIMEAINLDTGDEASNRVHGTLHYGGEWPHNVHSGEHYDPPTDVNDQMHTYAIEWQEGEIRWFVDEVRFATQTDWRSDGGAYPAPFDQRFHLILNLAVGGAWPGPPNEMTAFPQELVVDYVRVYECAADPETGRECGP